ncbi:MAG: cyclic nucleotide-binding domain-containing protein [Acidobacteria bacterium]|nr:MAG: cyclic nucleotide-binding domain-containing protein [Acidobacteriota bacterium]
MFKSRAKSVSRNPKQELARLQAEFDRGRSKEAIEELRALAANRPKSAALRVKLAEWLAKAGRRDEAISELYKLQEALSLQGDVLAAISAGLRIVQIDPTFDNPLSYLAKLTAERLKEETTTTSASDGSTRAESDGAQHKMLSEIPLLSDLTPEELKGVALGMKQRLLYDSAVVFERGDASRTLCFVVSGTLEIKNGNKTLDTAYPGECLGEFAFLTGEPRSATVISLGESEVLELSLESMEEIVRNHPRVRSVLDRMYQGRVLARVLAESPLFEFMSAGERIRVASCFEHMKVPRGIRVVEEGANDGALFLVKQGALEIFSQDGERIGKVGPNQFFGEVSFLTGVPRTATITTTEDSELLRIDGDDLNEFAAEYPQLLRVMKECREERIAEAMQRAKARA